MKAIFKHLLISLIFLMGGQLLLMPSLQSEVK